MHASNRPQLLQYLSTSVNFTPFATNWIPGSAKFLTCGETPRASGILKILELHKDGISEEHEIPWEHGVKCMTFAGSYYNGSVSIGTFKGEVSIYDIHHQAHEGIVNAIDGCRVGNNAHGPAEIASCGRDGKVRIWDQRVADSVVTLDPSGIKSDCWTVASGDACNDSDRCIVAGFDNGDVKMLDLRSMQIRWETNLGNGVCHLAFDRKDIPMNKLHASCIEGQLSVFEMRTFNPKSGYARLAHSMGKSTVWSCLASPHNRDVVAVSRGDGSVKLLKYSYPMNRVSKDDEGLQTGVTGSWVELVESESLSSQPIVSLDWHPQKKGLIVTTSFDKLVKVVLATGIA